MCVIAEKCCVSYVSLDFVIIFCSDLYRGPISLLWITTPPQRALLLTWSQRHKWEVAVLQTGCGLFRQYPALLRQSFIRYAYATHKDTQGHSPQCSHSISCLSARQHPGKIWCFLLDKLYSIENMSCVLVNYVWWKWSTIGGCAAISNGSCQIPLQWFILCQWRCG